MKEKNKTVQVKLTNGTNSYDFKGECVIAIITEPEGQDANTAAIVLGGGSPFNIAVSAAGGIASFIDKMADTDLERAALTAIVVEKLRNELVGEGKEKHLFEGTLEEFLSGKKEG